MMPARVLIKDRTRRLALLAVTALAAGSHFAGPSLASLSDTEASTGQSVTAGRLTVAIDGGEFTVADMVPGQTGSRILTVQNTGSVPGVVALQLDVTADGETGPCTAAESSDPDEEPGGCGSDGELDNALRVTLTADTDGNGSFDRVVLGPDVVAALAGRDSSSFILPVDARYPVRLDYMFPDSVGGHDEAMADTLAFDILARLESR